MPNHPAWFMIAIGVVLIVGGAAWLLLPAVPWLGRLPGDIAVEGKRVRVYFPIVTCLLLSALLTAISWMVQRFLR